MAGAEAFAQIVEASTQTLSASEREVVSKIVTEVVKSADGLKDEKSSTPLGLSRFKQAIKAKLRNAI